jgi:hypothetical protein
VKSFARRLVIARSDSDEAIQSGLRPSQAAPWIASRNLSSDRARGSHRARAMGGPDFARVRWLAMTQSFAFSRRVFLIRARAMNKPVQKTTALRSSSECFGCGTTESLTIRHGATKQRTAIKGSRTPKGAISPTSALSCGARPAGRARLPAFHCGSCQGDVGPQGSASGHASGDSSGAHDLMDRQPGRRSCTSPRVLPAPSCHRPASTSRAGHSAGRVMPKPPGSRSDELLPAGTASRSAGRGHRPASLYESETNLF